MRRANRAVAGLVLMAAAACGGSTAASSSPEVAASSEAAQSSERPAKFEQRAPLPSCGEFTYSAEVPREQWTGGFDCFQAAMDAGTSAELVFTHWSDDSGPYTRYVRTTPELGKAVEVYSDLTSDGDGWSLSRCERFDPVGGLHDCNAIEAL